MVQTMVRTKENVEKKQALTYEEMEAEREEVIYPNLPTRALKKKGNGNALIKIV